MLPQWRLQFIPVQGNICEPFCDLMRCEVPKSLVDHLRKVELTPMRGANVDPLHRFRTSVPYDWPLCENNSFRESLYIYYKSICVIGQINVARTLLGLIHVIGGRCARFDPEYRSDVTRSLLKHVSDWAFPLMFGGLPEYRFLLHMHTMGGRSPYIRQKIIDDISAWVDYKPLQHPEFFKECLSAFFTKFSPSYQRSKLDFKSFCNDPLRWGTSGGAPASEISNKRHRTKWAWAFAKMFDSAGNLLDNVDLYASSLQEQNLCNVALKEEPSKTRPVITTPMPSYLRQSYLLFRHGKPAVNSPIGSGNWLAIFQKTNYKWYGCLDGERFDHCIPADAVFMFIDKLGELDDECRKVADEELESLRNLVVVWGDREWRWRGGLLSGWRITSILGSFFSWCAFRWLQQNEPLAAGIDCGVMGDDIIYYSNASSITQETMVHWYRDFGLKANMRKTTSGPVGEFLRKSYSKIGVFGYPALAVRSIFFANPWIEQYQLDKHQELVRSILTLYSRIMPLRTNDDCHSWFFDFCLVALEQQFGKNSSYANWLSTPMSFGGGGPIEWSDVRVWTEVTDLFKSRKEDSSLSQLYSYFGIKRQETPPPASKRFKFSRIVKLNMLPPREFYCSSTDFSRLELPQDINITIPIFRWYLSDSLPSHSISNILRIYLPRGLRVQNKQAILEHILGLGDRAASLISVQSTPEALSMISRSARAVVLAALRAKKFTGIQNVKLSIFHYLTYAFRDYETNFGSW